MGLSKKEVQASLSDLGAGGRESVSFENLTAFAMRVAQKEIDAQITEEAQKKNRISRILDQAKDEVDEMLQQQLKYIDANGDGEVDGDELAAWLAKRLGVDLSAGDRRTLVDCLDVDASGTISHDEFLDFVVEPPAGREIGQVARRLRKALGEDGLLSLRAELARADANRDGAVAAEAFWEAVRAVAGELGVKPGKLDVRPADRRALEERFCSRGDESRVRHAHILQWLEAGLVDRALARLRRRLEQLEKRRGNGGASPSSSGDVTGELAADAAAAPGPTASSNQRS